MKKVGIASCAHAGWIASSITIGRNLAYAVGDGAESLVYVPVDKEGLVACLEECDFFIMHTHGCATSFIDQRVDNRQVVIASLDDVKQFPAFPKLKLVVITACETASDAQENIARALSRCIAKDGLVIANRYQVYGADYDFGEYSGKHGWIGYQNGEVVLQEWEIPNKITMDDAYRIYRDL